MWLRHQSRTLVVVLVLAALGFGAPPAFPAGDHGSGPEQEPLPLERLGECSLREFPVPGAEGGPPIGIDIPLDPPASFVTAASPERRLTPSLPRADNYDQDAWTHGASDGRLIVLWQEDRRLVALRSTDGGVTFGTETEVAGGTTSENIGFYDAAAAADGSIHVVAVATDPDGGTALLYARGDNFGATWTTPVQLVDATDPAGNPGPYSRIDARGSRVAILTISGYSSEHFVLVSQDRGDTWTTPVRVDPAAESGTDFSFGDVALDDFGYVYVAYSRYAGGLYSIFHTRSTDGGLTFEPEGNLDDILPTGENGDSVLPEIEIASDGSVLVSFCELFFGRLYVARSTDTGQNFALSLQDNLSTFDFYDTTITTVPGSATVLLTATAFGETGPLEVRRSADHGASFAAHTAITSSVYSPGFSWTAAQPIRTQSGRWALPWTERTTRREFDILVSISGDDGVTWGAPVTVNSSAPLDSTRLVSRGGIATVFPDRLVLAYGDNGGTRHGDRNIRSVWSDAATPVFAPNDRRVDTDSTTIPIRISDAPVVFTDDADGLYAAFTAYSAEANREVYVVASGDRGLTLGPAVRASGDPIDLFEDRIPVGAAIDDGHVYVAYQRHYDDIDVEIRFSRSVDYGATWTAADLPLFYNAGWIRDLQVLATREGFVYVAWNVGDTIYVARSGDFGSTFTTQTLATTDLASVRGLRSCAQGYQLVLGYNTSQNAYALFSRNAGIDWQPEEQLVVDETLYSKALVAVCDGSSSALVATTYRATDGSGETRAAGRRLDRNLGWEVSSIPVETDSGYAWMDAAFASPDEIVVVYNDGLNREVRSLRSSDGGVTFAAPARLDDIAPAPSAYSPDPYVASDGLGNVWVLWPDESTGRSSGSVARRASTDGGATWGAVERLDQGLPQGTYSSHFERSSIAVRRPVATDSELLVAGWRSGRESVISDAFLFVEDLLDIDLDSFTKDIDCNDRDAGIWSVPGPVVDVSFLADKRTMIWNPPLNDGGRLSSYDVLRSDDPTVFDQDSVFIEREHTNTAAVDDEEPIPGAVFAYILRANNDCGTGSWGTDSSGSERPVTPPAL